MKSPFLIAPMLAILAGDGMAGSPMLTLTATIPLPECTGRIDHMAFDQAHGILFVAELGAGRVSALDIAAKKEMHSVGGLQEPQGIAFLPEHNQIAVACGGDGQCRLYDATTLLSRRALDLVDDADNVRLEPATQTLYVGHAEGGLAAIDVSRVELTKDVGLPGHPESFQIDRLDGRIFVNVPSTRQIFVVNRLTLDVERGITLPGGVSANFAMALDEEHHRLFVCCRQPSEMLIYAADTFRLISRITTHHDVDDVWYDAASGRLFLSCGEGYIDIVKSEAPGRFVHDASVPTAEGARTSLLVPGRRALFVAVPSHHGETAEILEYLIH